MTAEVGNGCPNSRAGYGRAPRESLRVFALKEERFVRCRRDQGNDPDAAPEHVWNKHKPFASKRGHLFDQQRVILALDSV